MRNMNKFGASILSIFFIYVSWNFCQAQNPQVKVPADSNWCLGCICEAISNCNRSLQCSGDVCGLFRITWAYWADAGKPTVKNEDPNSNTAYSHCTSDEKCAGTTVANYLKKFAKDCNGDGVIDCYDYAAIHKYGGYEGCKQPLAGEYLTKFSTCEKHVQTLGVAPGTQ